MASWLYPISRRAGRVFDVGKDEIPASASSFRALVLDGRINVRSNRLWYVTSNFKVAEAGDDVFIYAGRSDGDLGIIGIGKIRGVRWIEDWETWAFNIWIDLEKSKELLEHPIPARIVREWIRFPRSAVRSLSKFERELQMQLPWKAGASSTHGRASSLKRSRKISVYIDSRVERRELAHDSILRPIVSKLEKLGMTVVKVKFGRLVPDLSALSGWGGCVMVEAKKNSGSSTRNNVRQALGQLFEYAWLYRGENPKNPTLLWIALRLKPPHEIAQFLEEHQVVVSWSQKTKLAFFGTGALRLSRFARGGLNGPR